MTNNNSFNLFGFSNTGGSDLFGGQGSSLFGEGNSLFGEPAPADPFHSVPANPAPAEQPPVVQIKPKTNAKPASGVKGATNTKKEVSKKIKEQVDKKAATKVDPTWEVAYAGQRYNPPHEMTLDELRQFLEMDYPELSKERCRIEMDEERKLLIPIVSGAKKG